MTKKTLRPLPFILFLTLFAFATPALAQSWSSASGQHTIEAEFIQVKDDKVQLKKVSNGKLIWVDLEKLSDDAQKQAKRLQKEADAASGAKTNQPDKAKKSNSKDLLDQVKLKYTAEIKESKFQGEGSNVVVSVIASGPPAAEAMKYGKLKLKKFTDGSGAKLTPEEDKFSMNDITKSFEKIERGTMFSNHPEDGVAVELKLPATVKIIGELSGTFSILTGGERSIESIASLSDQFGKTVKSDALKKAKLKIQVDKPTNDDGYGLSFNVSGNLDSLNRIWIGDANQKELKGQSGSSSSGFGKNMNYSFFFKNDVSDTAVLFVETVEGAVELQIPIELSATEVEGASP